MNENNQEVPGLGDLWRYDRVNLSVAKINNGQILFFYYLQGHHKLKEVKQPCVLRDLSCVQTTSSS